MATGSGFSAVLDDMDADTRQGVRLLTTVAVQRADETGLNAIDAFLTGQRRAVSGLLDRVDHVERDRTHRSLDLLDSVGRRADGLRAAIACGCRHRWPATRSARLRAPAPPTADRPPGPVGVGAGRPRHTAHCGHPPATPARIGSTGGEVEGRGLPWPGAGR